jgi:hypothetical protein
MKKTIIIALISVISASLNAQTLTLIGTSNGISPIPLFSSGAPSVMVFVNTNLAETKNKRFSLEYDPDFTYALPSGNGWFCDQWIKGNIWLGTSRRWQFTGGLDWSFIFTDIQSEEEKISRTVRYPTFQLRSKFFQSKNNTFTLDYWYTYAIEKNAGVAGSYVSLAFGRQEDLNKFSFATNPNVFYISYNDGTKGFAGSLDATIAHKKSGLFINAQMIEPFNATNSKFAWAVSIGISRKLF